MAPVRTKKRTSDQSASAREQDAKTGNPLTPTQASPIKKRKMGINAHQKQALIENLQLEITERARRLRAQYHLQAQGLRSRIEIRINRIPTSLRKMKMGDLLQKYIEQEKRGIAPPVPAKDVPSRASPIKAAHEPTRKYPGRPQKRLSSEISGDKENDIEHIDGAKKRARGAQATSSTQVRPAQVLSPTSSNSRLNRDRDRPASPAKAPVARPGSPLKTGGTSRSAAATNLLSSMVERAKSSHTGQRKVTTASNTSSSSAGASAPAKSRRGVAPLASRPATRATRRGSENSETSEGSATTLVRKAAASKTAAPTKKKVMGAFRRGAAAVDTKKTTSKATTGSATATGRVLRKRG